MSDKVGVDRGKVGAVVRRHQAGHHSGSCQVWGTDYRGYICRYSWEPHGETAHTIQLKAVDTE